MPTDYRRPRSTIAGPSQFFKGGVANIEYLRAQSPLSETAYELFTVSRSLGEANDAVYLGKRATETAVKALSASGALQRARIIHFATHGLLASESELFGGTAEPALLLTPPDTASEADDGLLTGSEVARLKLDADWVVLSACNTAAGGGGREQYDMLSGLARSFFYAGARALMVSHWAVNSDVTVRLVTGTFGHLRTDPGVGRAEALRLAMLEMLKSGHVTRIPQTGLHSLSSEKVPRRHAEARRQRAGDLREVDSLLNSSSNLGPPNSQTAR